MPSAAIRGSSGRQGVGLGMMKLSLGGGCGLAQQAQRSQAAAVVGRGLDSRHEAPARSPGLRFVELRFESRATKGQRCMPTSGSLSPDSEGIVRSKDASGLVR